MSNGSCPWWIAAAEEQLPSVCGPCAHFFPTDLICFVNETPQFPEASSSGETEVPRTCSRQNSSAWQCCSDLVVVCCRRPRYNQSSRDSIEVTETNKGGTVGFEIRSHKRLLGIVCTSWVGKAFPLLGIPWDGVLRLRRLLLIGPTGTSQEWLGFPISSWNGEKCRSFLSSNTWRLCPEVVRKSKLLVLYRTTSSSVLSSLARNASFPPPQLDW